ncbi:MAG: sensor histidine kinase [Burkholderiaceae bacterium]
MTRGIVPLAGHWGVVLSGWVLVLAAAFLAFDGLVPLDARGGPAIAAERAWFLPSSRDPASVERPVVAPPTDWSAAIEVVLPDVWGYLRPEAGDEVWYRVPIDDGGSPDEPVWVLIERVRSSAQAYAAGRLLWEGGRVRAPTGRTGAEPYAFAIPRSLLSSEGAFVLLRVRAASGERGGLGRVVAGSYERIQASVNRLRFWSVGAVYVTSAVIVATSLFILLLWWQIRDGLTGYLSLATAGLIWGVRNLNLVFLDLPPENPVLAHLWTFFATCGNGWVIGLLGWFLTRHFVQRIHPRLAAALTWIIPLHMMLGPVLLMTSLPRAEMLAAWIVLSVPVIVVTIIGLLHFVLRDPKPSHVGFLVFFVAVVVFNIYDNFTLRSRARFGDPYVSHFAGVVFFMMVVHVLVSRYGALMRDYHGLNASLEQRLRQQQDQLTLQHTELVRLEAERVQARERGRIMRDLHDGLGSQLTAALYQTRAEGATRIESILQECLDDLRLAIYSFEPSSGYVATVLGTLRQRLAPALEAAGVRLIWDVEDVGRVPALDSSRTLDLLRIVQEAISNAIKHARASQIRLGLMSKDGRVRIEVEDDGQGIDLGKSALPGGGRGIGNMRRRAAALGAELDFHDTGHGTRVVLDLPDRAMP